MHNGTLRLAIFLTLCGLAVLVDETAAANWPRFRGPNGTGIATDKDIPVQWTPKDILWKVPLPGSGNSSPIVWGNRIFLQASSPDGQGRLMLCLNTADGQIVWQQKLPGSKAKHNGYNSLASSTPATDGERVYAAFWSGNDVALYAFDFRGKQVWKRDLGTFVSQHGPGASPVVYGDKVYFLNDQDKAQGGPSQLLALDAKTGQTAWQVERQPYRASYAAPFLLEKPGGISELIVATTTGVHGYDPANGKENWVWHFNFTGKMPLRMVGSPLYHQGMIFAPTGDGSGERHFACLKVGDKGDVSKTNTLWESRDRNEPYVPGVLAWGDHIYSVRDKAPTVAECRIARTGARVWSERLGGDFMASPILIDGKIYAVNLDGDVFVFPAAPEFKLLAKNSLGEGVTATPAVADNRLYIRGRNHLFCIGKGQ